MEKDRGGRILALAALLVGVIGLSLGFAAFSSTLNITANANVSTGANWNVGFSSDGSNMAALTISGASSISGTPSGTNVTGGSVKLMKYTLYQDTAATLTTAAGASVTYPFYILNAGDIDAVLSSISLGTLTCAYASGEGRTLESDESNTGATVTAETGTISNQDCATMFTAKLVIGGTDYDSSQNGLSVSLPHTSPNNKVAASLVITSTGTTPTNVPTGDFTVSLSNTTVNYSSATGA